MRQPPSKLHCLAFVVLSMVVPTTAFAHGLGGDCRLRAGKLHVEGYYSDGTAAAFADVRVIDATNKAVIEGKLDGKGLWQSASPPPGSYTVILQSDGHGKRFPIRVPNDGSYSGRVSTDVTKEEFTAFPWANVAIGLSTIAILGLAIFFARAGKRNGPAAP